MKLVTVKSKGKEKLCVCASFGFVPMKKINRQNFHTFQM